MEELSPSGGTHEDPHNAITFGHDSRRSDDVSDNPQTEKSELQTFIRDLERIFTGSPGVRLEYQLNPHDFGQFVEYLENKTWNKIRYDYFFDTQKLVLRMPSVKHEYTSTQIIILLHTRIEQLCNQHQVKCPFWILGSADVKKDRNVFQPDNSIYHVGTRMPVLVLEVGNTQSAKSLNEKAKAYIQNGGGKIRYVFTLKLDRDSQAVHLTTWTHEFVHEGQSKFLKAKGTCQTIRDATGEPGSGAGLAISVDKITPGSCLPESLRQQTIVISVEELCEIVKGAEDFEIEIPEETFGDIPEDFVRASSPASSTSTGSDHEEEDGDEKATADDDDVLPRSRCLSNSYRSPIKTRAGHSSKSS